MRVWPFLKDESIPTKLEGDILGNSPALKDRESKSRRPSEDRSPEHQTYAYPEQQLASRSPEAKSYKCA